MSKDYQKAIEEIRAARKSDKERERFQEWLARLEGMTVGRTLTHIHHLYGDTYQLQFDNAVIIEVEIKQR